MKKEKYDFGLETIIVIITLFISLFAISYVSDLTQDYEKFDYVYSTSSNYSVINFNSTENATHEITVGDMYSITGETPIKSLTATIENINPNGTFSITTYLNGVSLGIFSAINNTNTTQTFSDVNFNANTVNNVTYSTDYTGFCS